MAFLFCDSFDHYATADMDKKWASGTTISAGSGRHSSAAAQVGGGSGCVSRTFAPASATAIVGCAVSPGNLVSQATLLTVKSGGTYQVTLGFDASGFVTIWRGHPQAGGVLLGTAVSGAIASGTFGYFELKTAIHASAGTAVARVNGTVVLTLSGVNTAMSGSAVWDSVGFYCVNGTQYYDDLYVLDDTGSAPWNDFLGDCRCDASYPAAAGATTQWTPSTGANYTCVDETAPNGDTDYVAAAASGLTDTYAMQDAAVVGGTIHAVQLNISHKKTDSGTCSLVPVVRHSGTDNLGATITPGTSYGYAVVPYATNPGTSAAWTEAGFNAAEFGVKRTA